MNEHRDVHASVLRFLNHFCNEMATVGYSLTPQNLEAFANPQAWPAGDFVGLGEFQMDISASFVDVTLALVVSTVNDENLFRMNEILDQLSNRFMPGRSRFVPVVSAETGAPRGKLFVIGSTRIGAVEHTITQPARPLLVRLKSDQGLSQGLA